MTVPTRADIATLIASVPVASRLMDRTRAKARTRNQTRYEIVVRYINDVMKDERPELRRRILADLASYEVWEREDVDGA